MTSDSCSNDAVQVSTISPTLALINRLIKQSGWIHDPERSHFEYFFHQAKQSKAKRASTSKHLIKLSTLSLIKKLLAQVYVQNHHLNKARNYNDCSKACVINPDRLTPKYHCRGGSNTAAHKKPPPIQKQCRHLQARLSWFSESS